MNYRRSLKALGEVISINKKKSQETVNYIELIGPQAVGKTTLLNLLVKGRKKDNSWLTTQEAFFDIVDSLTWKQLKNVKSRLLYLIKRCNIIRYKENAIDNLLIKEFADNISLNIQKRYEYLMDAQFKSLELLDLNISSLNKYSMISWHWQALNRVFILETFDYDKTILFDEGPFKTNYGVENINLNKVNSDTLPKAIIYCTVSINENIKRIKNRLNATGRLSKIHNELNNEDLNRLVTYTHETSNRNYNFLKNLGIPSIEVDMSDQLPDSEIGKIHHFLDQYSNPAHHSIPIAHEMSIQHG